MDFKYRNDIAVQISVGDSRFAQKWSNKEMTLSELTERLSVTTRTAETVEEYRRKSTEQQSNIKDVGGFVGGWLKEGKRGNGHVVSRCILTLDLDSADLERVESYLSKCGLVYIAYSTHKHTKEAARLRLLFPLSRSVSPEEFVPLTRLQAKAVGIDMCDPSTAQAARLMYWPSTSKDGDYYFKWSDGDLLNPDALLKSIPDWSDASQWPLFPSEADVAYDYMRRAGDPTGKKGCVGAFCNAYTIEEAIDTFLSDCYTKAGKGRYTWVNSSVSAGLVCYERKYAYANNATDPANDGHVHNAFDLVRIHKYGTRDTTSRTADPTKLPSYMEMCNLVRNDAKAKRFIVADVISPDILDDITVNEDGSVWTDELETDKKGIKVTPENLKKIMLNDPEFKKVKFDLFSQRDEIVSFPCEFQGTHFREEIDETSLSKMMARLSRSYGIKVSIPNMIDNMLSQTTTDRGFHAVREFIRREEWDGVKRLDTFFHDFLGAEDNELNRACTRIWFVAAVARVFDSDEENRKGVKFDSMIVLRGGQGFGKSTFIEALAGRWYETLSLDAKESAQCEAFQRGWIIEIPELKGLNKAEMADIKDLITRRVDNFRPAYGRVRVTIARHSVLITATNEDFFLKDPTGNRRFWVIDIKGGRDKWEKDIMEIRGQLWAEAYSWYKAGQLLYLPKTLEEQMTARTRQYDEAYGDPLRDYLKEWLNIIPPYDWRTMTIDQLRDFYNKSSRERELMQGTEARDTVTVCEIQQCCYFFGLRTYTPQRISSVLSSLGWIKTDQRKRITDGGKSVRATVFTRPEGDVPPVPEEKKDDF